jgi:hypothetical protein
MDQRMTDNEQFEAYRGLSEQLHTQYNQRRDLEWKIHVAIWTLLSAVGYLLISEKLHLGCSLIFYLFPIIPLHAVWCVKIHTREFLDRDLSIRYRQAAERILTEQPKGEYQQLNRLIDDGVNRALQPPRWLRNGFESYVWWLVAEVGTTVLLAGAIVWIAW